MITAILVCIIIGLALYAKALNTKLRKSHLAQFTLMIELADARLELDAIKNPRPKVDTTPTTLNGFDEFLVEFLAGKPFTSKK